ncbi:DNA excision repair protein ERCC-1 [Collichthys lucidus]|uniref:DNA excision repair protein ERCC-1 n=1 Tax=Collichthys lucidus TaxID=240159 RepID=A0A4U5U005_COLLU|nr:DNA excision repair protein ERCC-1 [Collichthys lucidus]
MKDMKKRFNINLDDSAFTKERIPPKPQFQSSSKGGQDTSAKPASEPVDQPLSYADFIIQSKSNVREGPSKQLRTEAAAATNLKQSEPAFSVVCYRRRGNPILKFVRSVPWEFGDVVPDYVLGQTTCALFLSPEEAGRYLETYKSYEKKPADLLKEQVEKDYLSKSVEGIINASKEDLVLCPGLGPQKARRLHDVLHKPFLKSKTKDS